MIKAAIYARYSSDKQNEQSIEGQMRYCKKYAQDHDMEIVSEYIDRAISGTTENRPAFKRMMKDSLQTKWDVVLVYKLDRFSRNKFESANNKHILKQNNKKLISVTELIPDSPEGIILESLLEGLSEYYSAELSQKIKRGNHESRLKGVFTSGKPPFGYKLLDKHLQIDKRESAIVKTIFEFSIKGYSNNDIAYMLNSEEALNPLNKKFYAALINKILHNKSYTGLHEYGGIVYDNIYPQIIDEETWNQVQQERPTIKLNRQRPYFRDYSKSTYLLMPKVYCGNCKRRMETTSGTNGSVVMRYYYACKNHKKGEATCGMKAIRKELLEDVVFRSLKNILRKPHIIDKMAHKLFERHLELINSELGLDGLLKEREAIIDNIDKLVSKLNLENTKTVTSKIEKLSKKLQDLDLSIKAHQNEYTDHLTLGDVKSFLSYLLGDKNKDDEEFRRKLAKHFINYVIVYPNKIVVGLRGRSPNLPDFYPFPDFDNIDKCLISQDRRRKVKSENGGSPKFKFLRTEIDTVKCLFSCSEILFLLDKRWLFRNNEETCNILFD